MVVVHHLKNIIVKLDHFHVRVNIAQIIKQSNQDVKYKSNYIMMTQIQIKSN